METKSLLYGLIGFFIGGFIVSVAATTFDKPNTGDSLNESPSISNMGMNEMTEALKDKTGDNFDEAFIRNMIAHHEGAIEMAKLSDSRAKHVEIKQLSNGIIQAQENEISQMKQWQTKWGYRTGSSNHEGMGN